MKLYYEPRMFDYMPESVDRDRMVVAIYYVEDVRGEDEFIDHLRQVERGDPLGRHRHADHAARVLADEGHVLGPAQLRGHDEVALVLALLVVDDDDHPPAADLLDGVLDRREGRSGRDELRGAGARPGALRLSDVAHAPCSRAAARRT